MTFEQKMTELLCQNGIWPDDAPKIIAAQKAAAPEMDRWTDDIDGYPTVMVAVVWMGVKYAALQWIDANCPKAWYRPMFADVV